MGFILKAPFFYDLFYLNKCISEVNASCAVVTSLIQVLAKENLIYQQAHPCGCIATYQYEKQCSLFSQE